MPNFRHRLPRAQQRIYDRSNATSSIRLVATVRLRRAVAEIPAALVAADRGRVERLAQAVAEEITTALRVPSVRVLVGSRRPANARGELHGLYTPSSARSQGTVHVWMVTAKRGRIVAFNTFLRTILHELCHHLDYVFLKLPDSLHTEGFYRRESSLFYQVGGSALARRVTSPVAATTEPVRTAGPGDKVAVVTW